jgi:hypothetical protein
VNFRAVDKGASEETAETLNGMFRADFYRSGGKEITDNAVRGRRCRAATAPST